MSTWMVPGYTESRELGAGASGRVVQAVHDATGVLVAIKYLSERVRSDPSFIQGFRAEARLLGGLDSPHVVRLYEYVEAPDGAAIVMELVDGIALRALLRQEGATGPEAALVVLKGSLLGLAAAHRTGVVHRDYKPDNVLVAADGSSKLVDFGIAVDHGSTVEVAGTPAYMAPEQWQGQPASPAADVYAATATFYECLTGHKPFSGANFAELALQHIDAPVPDEDAPEAVRPLIRRGLAKSPRERPANAAVFVAELESVAQAAYGPDWEERGQRKLAALAALLPLLFPSSGGDVEGTTELATTAIRQPEPSRGWDIPTGPGTGGGAGGGVRGVLSSAVALATALAIIAGLLALAMVLEASSGGPAEATARSLATTSASPDSALPAPAPDTPRPSGSSPSTAPAGLPGEPASPSETVSASPDGPAPSKPVPSRSSSSPSLSPTASPSPSASTSPSTSPTTSSRPSPSVSIPPPLRVRSVSVTSFQQRLRGPTADASIAVLTDGTGPITVVVTWFTGDAQGELGIAEGSESFPLSGAQEYVLTPSHSFQGAGCYLGVSVGTRPHATNGNASQQIYRGCAIQ
ncbi:serine/threonine-protein kinase [Streptomyces albipurpureus]|uniref:non-specific serine/threonine protein kinase n=1 Tax=Streptomyces albipurpureus TaxID=2897419 RepID=A0ABT0UR63_9ACTN|nr:serine/threonine-protein kinase [Streptomyces sp. CWNU-1]MCM2390590.1 protein kinase [Streptomyces sp. CWNU-1]